MAGGKGGKGGRKGSKKVQSRVSEEVRGSGVALRVFLRAHARV